MIDINEIFLFNNFQSCWLFLLWTLWGICLQASHSRQCVSVFPPFSGYDFELLNFSRERVFILGPSHHVFLPNCALSSAATYQTPLYDLKIDQEGAYKIFTVKPVERTLEKKDTLLIHTLNYNPKWYFII